MLLQDIRLKNYLNDIIFPSPKEGMNPRSLAYLRIILKQKTNSVLFATLPKSGWNWTADILNYCMGKHFTDDYKITYSYAETIQLAKHRSAVLFCPADARAASAQKVRDIFPELNLDYCFHTHKNWKESPIWGLDEAKTVLVIRNIPTTLYSFYQNRSYKFKNVQECIDAGFLDRAIHFYNSWGKFCETHKNHKIYRFEDYINEPATNFADLIKYVFNIDISHDLLNEAINYFSIDKQKAREQKYAKDKNKYFYYQGALDYSHLIPKNNLDFIYKKLNKKLIYKFNYEYPEGV